MTEGVRLANRIVIDLNVRRALLLSFTLEGTEEKRVLA